MSRFVFESIGHLIGVAPKSGSSAIINQCHRPNLDAVGIECAALLRQAGWKITGVFREPIDRLESAYNFFKYGGGRGYAAFGNPATIREFIDAVLAGQQDRHWTPQHDLYSFSGKLLPHKCVPLEGFARVENATTHIECVGDYRITDLRRHYAKDFEVMSWL